MGDDLLLDFLVEEGREDDYALPTHSIEDFDGDEQDFTEVLIGDYEDDDDEDYLDYVGILECGCCACCGCTCDWD